ncbi:GTPase HflX [uncultured Phascolarctobacterium sp.]|jgi:GTP-binding protein HflX|uniref:GTPase HflX n=1 Tax=uncultured Phascolarctobacterium sp. TaxID=512296 RepID=UPI0025E4AD8B|nr:GTPase HflX [uncultured Phascolarctobacterium sp.]
MANEIYGNLKGIRNSVIEELKTFYDIRIEGGSLLNTELALRMADVTDFINREVSVYLSRSGQVLAVAVGNDQSVELPPVEGRRGTSRLSGVRCVHTHPNGNPNLSGVDISALKNNRFDAMVAIGVTSPNFSESVLTFGMITGIDDNEQYEVECYGTLTPTEAEGIFFPNLVAIVERILDKQSGSASLAQGTERAIIVGMEYGGGASIIGWSAEDSLEELKQLADTAGAEVVARFLQKRPKPDPAFFIGRGKVQELALYVQQENVDLCIFDDELSPAQQRNIEQAMGVRVLDRTALILDIFAQRAHTNEGKLQVELAQLQYTLPRIMGKGLSLSRLGGGIGTRGPGETKLEVDRRRIRDRIAYIKGCISKVKNVRTLQRSGRAKASVPTVSLVGYTNAGKSTLLNTLTNSDIYAQDQLFATLDPTTRQLELPNKQQAILTDTVGFIQRLPHQLVAAFQSTLEEVVEADVLLHVIDVSHELYKEQANAVYHVLEELGAKDKTIITVYNKIDKLPEGSALAERLAREENSICISAKARLNLDGLLALIAENLKLKSVEESFLVPYSDSAAVSRLHEAGTVLEQEYLAEGTLLKVRMEAEQVQEFEKYLSTK